MLVRVVVVTSSAPSRLFVYSSQLRLRKAFLPGSLPSYPSPGPHDTFPKRPQIQAANSQRNPESRPHQILASLCEALIGFRSGASQPVAALRLGWRILSGRATSAAGRRLDPQGELAPPAVLLCSLVKLLLAGVRVRPTSE